LAQLVVARRQELGMTAAQVVDAAGGTPSLAVLSQIENARRDRYATRTLVSLAKALGWEPESIDVILAGGDPIPAQHQPAQRSVADQLAELRARLDRLEEMFGIRRMLADAELEEVADRLHEEKRRAGRRP